MGYCKGNERYINGIVLAYRSGASAPGRFLQVVRMLEIIELSDGLIALGASGEDARRVQAQPWEPELELVLAREDGWIWGIPESLVDEVMGWAKK